MDKVCEALSEGSGTDPVLPWSYHDFLVEFRRAVRAVGLPPIVPYQMRHSGPAIDLSRGLRTRLDVKHRGRWQSESSVNRYAQKARLGVFYAKLRAETKHYLTATEQHIGSIVLGRMRPSEVYLPPTRA